MSEAGGCLCGAVRFTAERVDPEVHGCHCGMCRRWVGGPGLALQVEGVRFSGEAAPVVYASSDWAERGFCGRCGSSLYYRLKDPETWMFHMGAFDDQSAFRLAGEIYIDEKPPGYAFSGEHPRQTGDEFLASIGMKPD